MFKIEKKIITKLEKNYILLGFIAISIIALLIRFTLFDFKSKSYIDFLNPWFTDLKNNGGLKALAKYKGNYNAPYMTIMALFTYLPFKKIYLIKFISVIFDYVLAISGCLLVCDITKTKFTSGKSLLIYSIMLLLPQVIINSSLWGQCDSIYTAFIILSLIFLLRKKYLKSFIFLGVAFSFKLQAIFMLPLYLVLYVSKKEYSLLNFLIIPVVDFIMCLPAILFGRPIKEIILVYVKQTGDYGSHLVQNFPNIYTILAGPPDIFYIVGEVFTIAICMFILFYVIYKKVNWNDEKIITLSLYFIMIITFFLPGMHDRYLFVGEILCVLYYFIYRKNLPILIFMIICPLILYTRFHFHNIPAYYCQFLTFVYFALIAYFSKITFNLLAENSN